MTSVTASGATSYSLNASVVSNPIAINSPTTSTNYILSGTDANGCVGTYSFTLSVFPQTNITITPSPSGNAICAGSTATLTASGVSNYLWNTGSTSSAIVVNPTSVQSTYSVSGFDQNGCKDSSMFTYTVNQPPATPSYSGGPIVCFKTPTILTANDATAGVTYTWVGPAPSTHTVSVNASASITAPGTYVLFANSNNGCPPATQTVQLTGDTVKANFLANPLTGVVPLSVSFTNTSVGNSLGYNWNLGNGITTAAVNPSEQYTVPGTYWATLTATDAMGCKDTARREIIVQEVPTLVIIPNIFTPNGDNVNDIFTINATGISNFDCKVYDRWGLLLHEWTGVDGGWDGKSKNGNNCTDGTYFYIVTYNNNTGIYNKKDGFFQLIR